MAMLRRLVSSGGAALRRSFSTRSSAESAPTAVIHVARPFCYDLRGAARPVIKDKLDPAWLAARLDEVGAQVRIHRLPDDAVPRADDVDLRQLGVAGEDPDEIHLYALHDVDGPDYVQIKRLRPPYDQRARRRTIRRLRARGVMIARRAPPADPAGPLADKVARSVLLRRGERGDVRDSAAWIIGRLQVIGAKTARGVVRDGTSSSFNKFF